MTTSTALLQLLLLVGTCVGRAQAACVDDSGEHLSMAIDAAIMELQAEKGWFHNLRSTTGYANAMSVHSCTPGDIWKYPAVNEAKGILKRVLETGKLRVAGVQWKAPGAADYATDGLNPTGFWPEYMKAIAGKLSAHYVANGASKPIVLERVYYSGSPLVVDAVARGVDVDMSEPYYYLSGSHGTLPRIEAMAFSCVTAGLASSFFTRSDSGVTSVDGLYDAISNSASLSGRSVGFIGSGNYDAVSAMLPSTTKPTIEKDNTMIQAGVLAGELIAGYLSEGSPKNASALGLTVFETGIVSPRVALFRKADPECAAAASAASEAPTTVGLIIVAAVALVLVLLLGFVIMRERVSKPLFMPLLSQTNVEQVKPQL